jgi:enoyl-CoA hydratase/carnithine racemase
VTTSSEAAGAALRLDLQSIHQRTRTSTTGDITEELGSILRVRLNRPTKQNAMTSAMYVSLARIFNQAANEDNMRVVLWHGAGDSFCAGNDIEDFLKNPPVPGESPRPA